MNKKSTSKIKHKVTQAWQSSRPYQGLTEHDWFYIDVATSICSLMDQDSAPEKGKVEGGLSIAEFSVVVVSWFEDFINESGIWKSFTDKCKEETGQYVPFFDPADYDPDYINWQDFALLIWAWTMADYEGEIRNPIVEPIEGIARVFAAFFEELIESAPATSYYDDLFTIEDEEDFPAVRILLEWLSGQSWLYGMMDMQHRHATRMAELLEESRHLDERAIALVSYEAALDFALGRHSRFGGASMAQVASRLVRGNPEVNRRLEGLEGRITTEFIIADLSGEFPILEHPGSGAGVKTHPKSEDIHTRNGKYLSTSLVKWGDEFWVNGIVIYYPKSDEKLADRLMGRIPYLLATDEQKEKIRRRLQLQVDTFRGLHGRQLVLCEGGNEAIKLIQKFNLAFEAERAKLEGKESNPSAANATPPAIEDDDEDLLLVFCDLQSGIELSAAGAEVIDFLTENRYEYFQSETEASFSLLSDCPYQLARFIVDNYDVETLTTPEQPFDLKRDLLPVMWFLYPDKFEPGILDMALGVD